MIKKITIDFENQDVLIVGDDEIKEAKFDVLNGFQRSGDGIMLCVDSLVENVKYKNLFDGFECDGSGFPNVYNESINKFRQLMIDDGFEKKYHFYRDPCFEDGKYTYILSKHYTRNDIYKYNDFYLQMNIYIGYKHGDGYSGDQVLPIVTRKIYWDYLRDKDADEVAKMLKEYCFSIKRQYEIAKKLQKELFKYVVENELLDDSSRVRSDTRHIIFKNKNGAVCSFGINMPGDLSASSGKVQMYISARMNNEYYYGFSKVDVGAIENVAVDVLLDRLKQFFQI